MQAQISYYEQIFYALVVLNLNDPTISKLNETALADILLYGNSKKTTSQNSKTLRSTIKYIYETKRSEDSLF